MSGWPGLFVGLIILAIRRLARMNMQAAADAWDQLARAEFPSSHDHVCMSVFGHLRTSPSAFAKSAFCQSGPHAKGVHGGTKLTPKRLKAVGSVPDENGVIDD